jgi:hypothetical protein
VDPSLCDPNVRKQQSGRSSNHMCALHACWLSKRCTHAAQGVVFEPVDKLSCLILTNRDRPDHQGLARIPNMTIFREDMVRMRWIVLNSYPSTAFLLGDKQSMLMYIKAGFCSCFIDLFSSFKVFETENKERKNHTRCLCQPIQKSCKPVVIW